MSMDALASAASASAAPLPAPRLVFVQTLRTAYKRVNKAGCFNTRCFPTHSPSGHCESSFCGQPLVVLAEGFPQQTSFYAEFAPQDSPAVGHKSALSAEGFPGLVLSNDVVVFNLACHVWKYSWRSSRHTFNTPHVVRVYALDAHDRLIGAYDSAHFIVSSMRTGDLSEGQHSADLNQIFSAMGYLVPVSRLLPTLDFDEMSFASSSEIDGSDDMMSFDQASTSSHFSLSSVDEARFLAHESMRCIFQRLYTFMLNNYPVWRSAVDMRRDVEKYLMQSEGITLESLAHESAKVVRELPAAPVATEALPMQVSDSPTQFSLSEAMHYAQLSLVNGQSLRASFEVGGLNDLSGKFERDPEFVAMLGERKAKVGWSPVDVDLERRVSAVVAAVLSPVHFLMGFIGPYCRSDIFTVGVPNRPSDSRPTMFGASSHHRVVYIFPTDLGVLQVASMPSQSAIVAFNFYRDGVNSAVDIQVRNIASNTMIKNEHFVFKRLQ